jgi:hypothetical protein
LPPASNEESGKKTSIARFCCSICRPAGTPAVMEINDPSSGEDFEAQIATIEQLLQLARGMAQQL